MSEFIEPVLTEFEKYVPEADKEKIAKSWNVNIKIEEYRKRLQEENKNPVEEVINARKDKIEESNNSTSTSEIKIDGKPVSVNNNIGQPKTNNKVIIDLENDKLVVKSLLK